MENGIEKKEYKLSVVNVGVGVGDRGPVCSDSSRCLADKVLLSLGYRGQLSCEGSMTCFWGRLTIFPALAISQNPSA